MTKLTNRVISVFDKKTSMRLAAPEWTAVDDICKKEHIKRKKLFELIAANKDPKLGFTCSVRLFAITYMHEIILKNGYYQNSAPANSDYENIFNTIANMN
ncbi:MAG: ribbon-helix-helix domain-containing protein [Alphaproteobacteria bacterium]|nr:ribbon-helix-helix domain-containing protein [Alphaproteobacteria bacterium]